MESKEPVTLEFRGKTYGCVLEVSLDLIGGRWKALLLWHLGLQGVMRFGALGRLHPKLTAKMLTQQLKELEADGLVNRRLYAQVPPKVEYSLTDRGQALRPALEALIAWGRDYMVSSR